MIPFFRSGVVGMVLILLAAGWLYLYTHSHAVHPESQDAILSQLKDLKQLDSTWNVDVLKSQAGINKSYDPLTQPLAEFADLFAKLKPEVESSKNVGLVSDLASIEHAIDQKTVLIDDFKAHNALLTNSLRYVPTVNETIQNGLRAQRVLAVTEGSHVSVPDRLTAEQHPLMRGTSRSYRVNAGTGRLLMLVGFEEDISALVSNVLDYNSMPDAQSEASLYVRLERVEGTLGFYPASVRSDVDSLLLHLRAILHFREHQAQSLEAIAQAPVPQRIDVFSMALTKRFDSDLAQQTTYQYLLLVYSGFSLVALFGFAVIIVYRSATERRRLLIQVAQQTQELKESSLTDPLTGLRNRRFLREHIEADIALCLRRYDTLLTNPLAPSGDDGDLIFFLIDIDHFKEVNDTYGHLAGDSVLVKMSERLREITRDSDYLIRWGGEEFLVVARQTNRREAELLAERIRSVIGTRTFELPNGTAIVKTCSVGFACYPFVPTNPRMLSWSEIVQVADHELYRAKNDGRDRWAGLLSNDVTKPNWTLQGLLERANEVGGHSEISLVHSS
jgi:diguanylate cyclase (GGDEF)-like protein